VALEEERRGGGENSQGFGQVFVDFSTTTTVLYTPFLAAGSQERAKRQLLPTLLFWLDMRSL